MAPSRTVPVKAPQAAEKPRRAARPKRVSQLHRGVLPVMDAAVEARRDTEHVAVEYEVRREDVQDLFAWQTRRMLRQLEGVQRSFAEKLAEVDAMLRGETRAKRRAA
jgi:hypothetical protein